MERPSEFPFTIQRIRAHPLRLWNMPAGKWDLFTKTKSSDDWLADADLREGWVSPTCLLDHPGQRQLFVGLTALSGDVLYRFDPGTARWRSLAYPTDGDPYENKIHQSLVLAPDGALYGATATLADVDVWPRARGGRIFRYDPQADVYDFLCTLPEHDYVQTLALDAGRSALYLSTFPGGKLFRFDLATRTLRLLARLGNVFTEGLLLDARAGLWHNYELYQWAGRFPLFRYDPDRDEVVYLNRDLPFDEERTVQIRAAATQRTTLAPQLDSALTTDGGRSFIGTTWGDVVCVDPGPATLTLLKNPYPTRRLKLVAGPAGWLFGLGGTRYESFLFALHEQTGTACPLGPLQATDGGPRCWQPHHGAWVDGNTLFVAECDNPERAGFLFEVRFAR